MDTNFNYYVKRGLREGKIDAEKTRDKEKWDNMTRAWETIYGTFPGFPKNMNQMLSIYREMSVNDPEKISREIVEGTRKPGQYWSFDDSGAGSYMQSGSEETTTSNVRMEAEVPLKDVDPLGTIVQNFMYPNECEAALLTLDNLKLVKVEWMEQIEYERGGEPIEEWHEMVNAACKGNKLKCATRKKNKTRVSQEHVYRRDVTSIRGAMRPSIESLDIMVTMLIDDDNEAWEKYWEARWKPDFPEGVEDFEDFERWFDDLIKKAKKAKRKTLLTDIVSTLAPHYYHVAKREDIGVVFEADGVNANPECITIHMYTITFTGTNQGANVANDGVVVWPTKVISVEGPGDERLHVKVLNKQITKYYIKKR